MVGGRVRRRRIEPRPPTMCASVPSLRAADTGSLAQREPGPQRHNRESNRDPVPTLAAEPHKRGCPCCVSGSNQSTTRAASHRHSLEAATPATMYTDHQEHPVKRTPPHVLIVAVTAGAVTVFVVTALILCPPDRINPILEWFRIVTGAVG